MDCLEIKGCGGGTPFDVMKKFMDKPGCMKEEDYPYRGKKGQCKEDESKMVGKVINATEIHVDEDELKQKLFDIGPLSVSLLLNHNQFKRYKDGVMWCDDAIRHHSVVLVGYGEESKSGDKYWIIKNPWWEKWGQDGYLLLGRGSNQCNIVGKPARTVEVA